MEERLQLAVFIDFDNIEIGVKTTLNAELDLSLVLEALKERGEVVSKSAYGDWARAGMHSRTLTEHAVHMVQRNVTPRGDKNGADINLVVDALEMAFTRPHINGFVIVGGDSDFIALVEKLKQFGKRVFVVGGRSFTSAILQRNCHEFISYENLVSGGRGGRAQAQSRSAGRLSTQQGFAQVQRALKILSDRGVEPQLGPLKSTLLQLDSTFSERDYGTSSFREFIQRLHDQGYLHLRRIDQGYLVEMNGDSREREATTTKRGGRAAATPGATAAAAPSSRPTAAPAPVPVESAPDDEAPSEVGSGAPEPAVASGETALAASRRPEEAVELLRAVIDKVSEGRAGKPMYVRHVAQGLRAADPSFDEQAYGFRTLTELVHAGQREGILRMQRDRQGAWRITSAASAGGAPSAASVAGTHAVPDEAASGESEQAFSTAPAAHGGEVGVDTGPIAAGGDLPAAEPARGAEGAGDETDEPVVGAAPSEPGRGRRSRGGRGGASKAARTVKADKPAARASRPRASRAKKKPGEG